MSPHTVMQTANRSAGRAYFAVDQHRTQVFPGMYIPSLASLDGEDQQEALETLVVDVLHLAKHLGITPDSILVNAESIYEAENG